MNVTGVADPCVWETARAFELPLPGEDVKVKCEGLTPNNIVNYSLARAGYSSITPGLLCFHKICLQAKYYSPN